MIFFSFLSGLLNGCKSSNFFKIAVEGRAFKSEMPLIKKIAKTNLSDCIWRLFVDDFFASQVTVGGEKRINLAKLTHHEGQRPFADFEQRLQPIFVVLAPAFWPRVIAVLGHLNGLQDLEFLSSAHFGHLQLLWRLCLLILVANLDQVSEKLKVIQIN